MLFARQPWSQGARMCADSGPAGFFTHRVRVKRVMHLHGGPLLITS